MGKVTCPAVWVAVVTVLAGVVFGDPAVSVTDRTVGGREALNAYTASLQRNLPMTNGGTSGARAEGIAKDLGSIKSGAETLNRSIARIQRTNAELSSMISGLKLSADSELELMKEKEAVYKNTVNKETIKRSILKDLKKSQASTAKQISSAQKGTVGMEEIFTKMMNQQNEWRHKDREAELQEREQKVERMADEQRRKRERLESELAELKQKAASISSVEGELRRKRIRKQKERHRHHKNRVVMGANAPQYGIPVANMAEKSIPAAQVAVQSPRVIQKGLVKVQGVNVKPGAPPAPTNGVPLSRPVVGPLPSANSPGGQHAALGMAARQPMVPQAAPPQVIYFQPAAPQYAVQQQPKGHTKTSHVNHDPRSTGRSSELGVIDNLLGKLNVAGKATEELMGELALIQEGERKGSRRGHHRKSLRHSVKKSLRRHGHHHIRGVEHDGLTEKSAEEEEVEIGKEETQLQDLEKKFTGFRFSGDMDNDDNDLTDEEDEEVKKEANADMDVEYERAEASVIRDNHRHEAEKTLSHESQLASDLAMKADIARNAREVLHQESDLMIGPDGSEAHDFDMDVKDVKE